MGLTVHYELRLPDGMSSEEVEAKLTELREFSVTRATEISRLCTPANDWEHHIATPDTLEHHFRVAMTLLSDPDPDDAEAAAFEYTLTSSSGFAVVPGDGCEPATFGFILRRHTATGLEEWYWCAFCKTQFASNMSDDHFMRCHLALIAILDRAAALGIEADVIDEGGYWESRDASALLKEVRKINVFVAAITGALSDMFGDGREVEGPILEHPRFERLEMGESE